MEKNSTMVKFMDSSPTPPLEALKLLLSETATVEEGGSPDDKVIMINDVARAFFEAPVKRKIAVELPEEEKAKYGIKDDEVGVLQMSLYGTRDASANFQDEIKKVMIRAGFKVINIMRAPSTTVNVT